MQKFIFASSDFIFADVDATAIQVLTAAKTAEVARLMGIEAVQGPDEGTVALNGTTCNKANLTALKYGEEALAVFFRRSGSYAYWALLDTNFNKLGECTFYQQGNLSSFWGIKAKGCLLFRPNNMLRYESAVAVTYARKNDNSEVPVLLSVVSDSATVYCSCGLGSDNFSCGVVGQTYNTLISLQKCLFANLQLVCDHVYRPTHCGYDGSPKRFILNGEKWVSVGNTYSTSYYCNTFMAKLLDE